MMYGLIGRKLTHSYSPQIHKMLGVENYSLMELEPERLPEFMKKKEFRGINVTIPYKKSVIAYCDELTEIARRLGAVNTLIRRSDGTVLGHNSDYNGFRYMVRRSGLDPNEKKVLILGSGGAGATAAAVMEDLGAEVVIISRSGKNNYQNLSNHADAKIIVNATPVGMYPNNGHSPIQLGQFPNLEGVLDLIYNPAKTKLIMDAEERGLVAENGLSMLVAQAQEAAKLFTGKDLSDQIIEQILCSIEKQMRNIVLIGMPGCGKTTIGKILTKKLERPFYDADEIIQKKCNQTIPAIFQQFGESYFRDIETEVLLEYGSKSGIILSTGGGCVTQARNYPLLHQNSTIICIQRPVGLLAQEGRPLSLTVPLEQMYRARQPLYNRFADFSVNNDTTAEAAANTIVELWRTYHENTGY